MEKRTKETIKKILLSSLQGGLVITAVFLSPTFLYQLIRASLRHYSYKKAQEYKRESYRKAMQRLLEEKMIRVSQQGEKTVITLTKEGQKRVLIYKLDDLRIKKPKKWDHRWRIVAFDIPEKKKLGREVLRNKLKNLGFIKIQKSVWIFPYPCEKEIEFIRIIYEVRPYVTLFETRKIENEDFYKDLFHLTD